MSSCYHWALLAAALAVAGAPAQEKDEKSGPGPRPDANVVEIRFADDSTVKMVLQHSSIQVATRYGKLTVPVAEMRRIEFGLRIPEDTAKRIDTAIARLGSQDFKQREAAGAELLELRELAYPALQQAARSADVEVARRAKDALKTLTDTVPAEKLNLPPHDTVVAREFTIVGQVEVPALKVRTPYFGETSLKLADLRSLRWVGDERETKVAVDAAKYGGQQEAWLDTGIEVRAGANLLIAAAGTVDLRPVPGEAGTYVASPDGLSQRMGRAAAAAAGFGGVANRGGGGFGGGGPGGVAFGPYLPGALVGRVGENGKMFVVGSRFDGTATEEGKLYLRIVPFPGSPESSGTYNVRVNVGR
jgi:hypothetical protein